MQIHPVVKQVHRAVQRLIPPQAKVVVAVSGGADSIALADAVAELVQQGLCRAFVVHVEHGLRGQEALRDAEAVAAFCQTRQLPYYCEHVQVNQLVQEEGLSVEDAARRLRYQALTKWQDKLGADYLVTAHHRDDQAETVLLKLLRGAGTKGLAAMAERQGRLLRPFLDLERQTLEEYCSLQQLSYCYDSSNSDLHYSRNRVRLELLPYLERYFNPGIKQQLSQTARILQEDAAYLEEQAEGLLQDLLTRQGSLQVQDWSDRPAALRKRALRRLYYKRTGQALDYTLTEALDQLCLKGASGKRLYLPQGLRAEYAYGLLTLKAGADRPSAEAAFCRRLNLEEQEPVQLQGRSFRIRLVRGSFPGLQLPGIIYPLGLVEQQELCLRSRRPGDYFQPYGATGGKKLKSYFIDKKIPQAIRSSQVLLCTGEQVLGIFNLANGAWPQGDYTEWLVVDCG